MHIEGIALVVLLGVSASAVAFEPGNERVCKPSADGQTFECRDKVTGEVDAPPEAQETPAAAVASKVSAPVPAAPLPAPADDHDPTAPSTRKLPNYLMQRPQSQPSAPLATPPPAPATVEPRKAEPPPAAIVEAPKPAASPAPAPAAAPPDKPVVREAPATRAQAPETVSKPAAAAPAPVVTPGSGVQRGNPGGVYGCVRFAQSGRCPRIRPAACRALHPGTGQRAQSGCPRCAGARPCRAARRLVSTQTGHARWRLVQPVLVGFHRRRGRPCGTHQLAFRCRHHFRLAAQDRPAAKRNRPLNPWSLL
jgi:hypothetical protein